MVIRLLLLAVLVGACGGDDGVHHLADAPPPPGPDYIWYVLDEVDGTTAKDSSGNHYDITNLTGVTWSHGAQFDGTGGGGSVQVDASYRTPPVTISAWLKPAARADQTSALGALTPYPSNAIGDDIPTEFGYGIGLDIWTDGTPGGAVIVEDTGACVPGAVFPVDCTVPADPGAPSLVAGTEYLVTVVFTSTTASVYLDGALYHAGTAAALQADPTQFWLGLHNQDTTYGTKRFFAGGIRDVRVYKRALAAAEVAALYASGPTLTAP